jgi:hypothetical protein
MKMDVTNALYNISAFAYNVYFVMNYSSVVTHLAVVGCMIGGNM